MPPSASAARWHLFCCNSPDLSRSIAGELLPKFRRRPCFAAMTTRKYSFASACRLHTIRREPYVHRLPSHGRGAGVAMLWLALDYARRALRKQQDQGDLFLFWLPAAPHQCRAFSCPLRLPPTSSSSCMHAAVRRRATSKKLGFFLSLADNLDLASLLTGRLHQKKRSIGDINQSPFYSFSFSHNKLTTYTTLTK
jgi:hypothetical protein